MGCNQASQASRKLAEAAKVEIAEVALSLIPFILVEAIQWRTEYIVVNMDSTRHPLPLTTVYHQLQPINPSPYTLLQALFGHEYPVGLLDKEKILPVGKEINAASLCILKNGILEIKSCQRCLNTR